MMQPCISCGAVMLTRNKLAKYCTAPKCYAAQRKIEKVRAYVRGRGKAKPR